MSISFPVFTLLATRMGIEPTRGNPNGLRGGKETSGSFRRVKRRFWQFRHTRTWGRNWMMRNSCWPLLQETKRPYVEAALEDLSNFSRTRQEDLEDSFKMP